MTTGEFTEHLGQS